MRKPVVISSLLVLLIGAVGAPRVAAEEASCESLAKLALPNTKITLAQLVPAGTFVAPPPPFPTPTPPSYKDVPAFCRVTADVAPTLDSDIKIEVWMPLEHWNGKFRGQGNGGFAGIIDYDGMAADVKRGYAAGGTDTGHTTPDAAWALGHPEKVIDFGYRGVHEMTAQAKAITAAFYGHEPQHSYFASCSDGGREALMEAQRFPADYDGILAGAPANYWTHLLVGAMWDVRATTLDPASYIPASKIPALGQAVLTACDARDGLRDGILNDPRQCHFDPETMLCTHDDSNTCLTAPQVAALKKIYAGPHDSAGRLLFPGYVPGGEEGGGGWPLWITGNAPGRSLIAFFSEGYFTNMVYAKAGWDFKTFDIDQATRLADAKTADALNSTNPDLTPFMKRGGKLILYHGWSDAAISPLYTIDYYQSVQTKMGRRSTASFTRLFMAPGMQHCGGGPGPSIFGQDPGDPASDAEHNIYIALEQWVEKGSAPSSVIATKYVQDNRSQGVQMTRPLCPYPQIAKYKGSGDTNDAANFACAAGPR
ncbi:MAG TPA: tannase/feruloyl esterase family alpha/beta hydrolase [Terriglobia bacterium]|nr:tannase/feruloyl esterase family alpha/beta hydrolase [Terriglobia bacterium]